MQRQQSQLKHSSRLFFPFFHRVLTQVLHNCDLFQIRREYGCYDEVFFSNYSLNKRQCNWIRFLRIVQSYDEQVNLIGTKVKGELMHALKRKREKKKGKEKKKDRVNQENQRDPANDSGASASGLTNFPCKLLVLLTTLLCKLIRFLHFG